MNTKKFAICTVSIAPLRANASDESEMVSQLLFGDFIEILKDGSPWIQVKNKQDGYTGWMDFKQCTFIDPDTFKLGMESVQTVVNNPQLKVEGPDGIFTIFLGSSLPFYNNQSFLINQNRYQLIESLQSLSIMDTALAYLNAPYLWGGKSLFGIDCSGLVQNIFKTKNVWVPRDASEQVDFGNSITWSNRKAFDLVFFTTKSEKVTHVGVMLDENRILHAHGKVRIDTCDEKGIFNANQNKYTHHYHSTKRWI